MSNAVRSNEIRPGGEIRLFGHSSTPATVRLIVRSRRWRMARALRALAMTVVGAPLAGLVPPHAPWAIGAFVGGLVIAHRGWNHRYTTVEVGGVCPRCASSVAVPTGRRLRLPHPVSCETCRHDSALVVQGLPS